MLSLSNIIIFVTVATGCDLVTFESNEWTSVLNDPYGPFLVTCRNGSIINGWNSVYAKHKDYYDSTWKFSCGELSAPTTIDYNTCMTYIAEDKKDHSFGGFGYVIISLESTYTYQSGTHHRNWIVKMCKINIDRYTNMPQYGTIGRPISIGSYAWEQEFVANKFVIPSSDYHNNPQMGVAVMCVIGTIPATTHSPVPAPAATPTHVPAPATTPTPTQTSTPTDVTFIVPNMHDTRVLVTTIIGIIVCGDDSLIVGMERYKSTNDEMMWKIVCAGLPPGTTDKATCTHVDKYLTNDNSMSCPSNFIATALLFNGNDWTITCCTGKFTTSPAESVLMKYGRSSETSFRTGVKAVTGGADADGQYYIVETVNLLAMSGQTPMPTPSSLPTPTFPTIIPVTALPRTSTTTQNTQEDIVAIIIGASVAVVSIAGMIVCCIFLRFKGAKTDTHKHVYGLEDVGDNKEKSKGYEAM